MAKRKYKRLHYEDRQTIEAMSKQGSSVSDIAEALGTHRDTIYRVKVFPLDDSGNYAELASYLIKYTGTHKKGTDGALQGKRWNCSKNLVRPEPEYRIISDREYFKK